MGGLMDLSPDDQGLLQAAFAGLQASGPSRMPVSMGQVLGAAGAAGLAARDKAMQMQSTLQSQAMQRKMLEQQIAKAQQDQAMTQQLMEGMGGQGGLGGMLNDPDKMEQVGMALSVRGHPGGAGLIAQAEKIRQKRQQAETFKGMQGGVVRPGETGLARTDEEALQMAQDALRADPNARVNIGVDPKGTGILGSLQFSPHVGQEARDLQGLINQATPGSMTPADILKRVEFLTGRHLAATEAAKKREESPSTLKVKEDPESPTGWSYADGTGRIRFQGAPAPRASTPLHSEATLSDEAIRDLAVQSLYDPQATMGFRRDPKIMGQIANAKVKLMMEAGITSEDVVSGRAGFRADTYSLNKITPQYDAIVSFKKTAIRNGEILIELADKVDSTGTPVLERWIRAGRKSIAGDADVAKFDAQMNLYRAEAARILTQPNLTGVLTDTARKEMEHVLGNDATAKQVRETVRLLERDFNNRQETLEEQIGAIRARMRSRASPGGGANPGAAPAATGPKEGDKSQSRSGKPIVFRNGKWVYE